MATQKLSTIAHDLLRPMSFGMRGDRDMLDPIMRLFLVALSWLLLILSVPSRAGEVESWAAFRAGDYATAVSDWRVLAENGDPFFQYWLGAVFAAGLDKVPRDYVEAAKWYRLAANQGYNPAQTMLGDMYSYGLGVRRDFAEALRWYQQVGGASVRGKLLAERQLAAATAGCDPHYVSKVCVPIASDVDCAGGRGDGPAYVDGPFRYTGDDIYDLDHEPDGSEDGIACEPRP